MPREWLYFRIYPGGLERMNTAVKTLVAPAVQQAGAVEGIDRWFFLRYYDEQGPHIRLRFRGSAAAVNQLQQQVERWLQSVLPNLPSRETPADPRLLPLPQWDVSGQDAFYELDFYEPEYDIFGGQDGVRIVERLFQDSSELALRILNRHVSALDWQVVNALVIMLATAAELLPPAQQTVFWHRYRRYWAASPQVGSATLIRMAEAARMRAHLITPVLDALAADQGLQLEHIAYRRALRRTLRLMRSAGSRVSDATLCFRAVHLMNNRLGFLPFEEVYLALLLPYVR